MSHRLAKLGLLCTYSVSCTPWRKSSVAALMAPNALATRCRYCWPAGVISTPRADRSNSRTFSMPSSLATWWLTAEGVMCNSSAASAKLLRRAMVSKACRAARGGIMEMSAQLPHRDMNEIKLVMSLYRLCSSGSLANNLATQSIQCNQKRRHACCSKTKWPSSPAVRV